MTKHAFLFNHQHTPVKKILLPTCFVAQEPRGRKLRLMASKSMTDNLGQLTSDLRLPYICVCLSVSQSDRGQKWTHAHSKPLSLQLCKKNQVLGCTAPLRDNWMTVLLVRTAAAAGKRVFQEQKQGRVTARQTET